MSQGNGETEQSVALILNGMAQITRKSETTGKKDKGTESRILTAIFANAPKMPIPKTTAEMDAEANL